jgi:hypothetical protein
MPVLDGRVILALVDIRLTYFSAKVQGVQTPGYLPPTGLQRPSSRVGGGYSEHSERAYLN